MISIIVPIYKVEKYIRQCVDSIIAQSLTDIEIILVDDGSPDGCPAICDEYAQADSRVKVVHKKNGGLMSARQAGLKAATGDYIGFVDGDDWIEPDMYEHFANAIKKHKPDILMSEFYFSYPDRNEVSTQCLDADYFEKADLKSKVYPTMLFRGEYYYFGVQPCCWAKVYKKELLEKHLYSVTTKIKMGEDAAFTYPCLLDADNMCYIDKPLYHYRNNPQSMTNAYDSNMEDTILIPYEALDKCFKEYDYSDGLLNQLDNYLFYLLNIFIRNEVSRDNKKSPISKIRTFKAFTDNKKIISALRRMSISHLPLRKKLVIKLFTMRSPLLLYIYSVVLARLS